MDEMEDAKPVKLVAPAEVFRFLRENFVVLSGLAIVGGIALATIFLSSYLAVFDWHLLWFVQYTDIVTFGLIAVGLVGGSFIFLQSITQTLLSTDALQGKSKWRSRAFLLIIFGVFLALELYGAIKHGDGPFHILFGVSVIGLGVVLILLLLGHVRSAKWPTAKQATALVILSVLSAVFFGQWLGQSVLETSQFDQDVQMKTETLTGVKLISVMSRNTILLKEGVIYVVPTADVAEFRTAGKK